MPLFEPRATGESSDSDPYGGFDLGEEVLSAAAGVCDALGLPSEDAPPPPPGAVAWWDQPAAYGHGCASLAGTLFGGAYEDSCYSYSSRLLVVRAALRATGNAFGGVVLAIVSPWHGDLPDLLLNDSVLPLASLCS